jgi:hypothetical protein
MGKRKMSIPLAIVAPVIGAFAKASPRGPSLADDLIAGNINDFLYDFREIFGGTDNQGNLRLDWLLSTYGPIAIGAMVHKFVGGEPLNLNRALGQAGVPLIRI